MAPSVFVVGSSTSVGQVRDLNEDSYGVITEIQQPLGIDSDTIARKGALFAVADGMGGHAAGEVASQMAIELLFSTYYADSDSDPRRSLGRAFEAVNTAIHSQAAADEMQTGMGTTLVAAVLRDGKWWIANVGDSRAYLIRTNKIRQVTRDHSWVTEQLAAGVLTEEEARDHPYRNIVTRSMGQNPGIKVDHFELKANPGDRLLLCSDGLSNMVGAEAMEGMIQSQDVDVAAKLLVVEANAAGGPDNITAIVVESQGIQKQPVWLPFAVASAIVAMIIVIAILWGIISPPPESTPPVTGTNPMETITATPDTVVVAPTSTPRAPTVTLAPTHTSAPIPTETSTPTPTPVIFVEPRGKLAEFRSIAPEQEDESSVPTDGLSICRRTEEYCLVYFQGQLGNADESGSDLVYSIKHIRPKDDTSFTYDIHVEAPSEKLNQASQYETVGVLARPRRDLQYDAVVIVSLRPSTSDAVRCVNKKGINIENTDKSLGSYTTQELLYPSSTVDLPTGPIWVFGFANPHSLGDLGRIAFCERTDSPAALYVKWSENIDDETIEFEVDDRYVKNCDEGYSRIFIEDQKNKPLEAKCYPTYSETNP